MHATYRDTDMNLPETTVPLPTLAGEPSGCRLHGRRTECEALDRLIAHVRVGQSRVLVLRGEAGTGKTALLEYLVQRAVGCRIVRAAGAEPEMEMAFAGLHQLCAPFMDRLGRLPDPQRDALETAFSLRDGDGPDSFAVGLAALSLASDVARERPLICVVDDAQWLDRASARVLAFVARHLAAAPVALVFALRQPGGEQDLSGLPEVLVGGLADGDARALLASVVIGPLDERVRDRIVAETRGNPQALLQWPRRLMPGELAGGFGLPGAVAPTGRIEQCFRRRFESLPESTRLLLVAAAADPTGDPVLVWRAAGQLGVEAGAAAPATAVGLIEFRGLVRFCHPLARAAVYWAASPRQRQGVHRALADATDPDADPDRRAWHLAHAAPGLDEGVAAELERSAGQAGKRGGLMAAAAFAERAAELTPDPVCRARRALTAAQVKHQAGAPDAALLLLAVAQAGPLDEPGRARAELLRAQLAADSGRGRDAFIAALTAGRLATGDGMLQAAEAARGAPQVPEPARATDLLLDGLAVLIAEGPAAGAPLVKRALGAFRSQGVPVEEALRWLPLACRMSRDAWDDDGWHVLSARLIELARQAGALTVLPAALLEGVAVGLVVGDPAMAASLTREAAAVARVTGSPVGSYGPLLLAAWAGREAEATHLITAATPEMMARGEGQWLTTAAWATALLYNGLGRYDQALAAAERGSGYPPELGLATWSLAELIEAAARP